MPEVTLYATAYCPFCNAAKDLLQAKGVSYSLHDLTDTPDPEARNLLLQISGRTTVPQIWIGERHIGGYTDLEALDRSGELDELLAPGSTK